MSKLIEIKHMGNVGNRIFQYMFARTLQGRIHDAEVIGYNIPGWSLRCDRKIDDGSSTLVVEGGHAIDVNRIAYLINAGIYQNVSLKVFAQRMDYLPYVDVARAWFAPSLKVGKGATGQQLLINVRGAEILSGLHKDYMPLQIDFYKKVLDFVQLEPTFVGQIGDEPYGQALRAAFCGAEFVPSTSPLDDFAYLYNSINILCCVSSFSWIAAWLSPSARTIHLPLCGIFNPAQRPDIDLMPVSDLRYQFYDFPILKWTGDPSQVELSISGAHDLKPVHSADAGELRRRCQPESHP